MRRLSPAGHALLLAGHGRPDLISTIVPNAIPWNTRSSQRILKIGGAANQ
jgi:hypothetical protein